MKYFLLALSCLLSASPLSGQSTRSPGHALKSAEQEVSAPAPQPWSAVGVWDCTHPAWKDQITLAPDGTFSRRNDGSAGHWTFSSLQGQVILLLAWNDWSPETAAFVGPDEFRGKIHTQVYDGELIMRRAPSLGAAGDPVKILAASYSFGSQYADVTQRVKELLRTGQTFQANPWCLLTDPQPGWNKCLVVVCEVRGKRTIYSVGEGENVSHDLLLDHARLVADEPAVAKEAGNPMLPPDALWGAQMPDGVRRTAVSSNGDGCAWSQADDKAVLTLPGGIVRDFFGGRCNAPRVLTPVEGDFRAQVRVAGNFDPGTEPAPDFPRAFHGAGLLVFGDEANYVRFERAEMTYRDEDSRHVYWHPLVQQNLAGEYNEFMGPPNSPTPVFTEPATDLSLERTGNTMVASVSSDGGAHWNEVARFETMKAKRVLVGISASNTSARDFKPEFMGLTVSPLISDMARDQIRTTSLH